jgi:hypothetical protein
MQRLVKQLIEERGRIDGALKVLGAATSSETQAILGTGKRSKRRTMIAAARKRIAEAETARWAKQKGASK